MIKRVNFFQRVKKGFGNLFVSAKEKERRAKVQHAKEREEYLATIGKDVQRSKTNKDPWTSDELRGFQEIATDELLSKNEISDIKKTKALEDEIERRSTKIIAIDDKRKKEIMQIHNTDLRNAKNYETQGRFALAENFYIRAAKMSRLMGDDQQALELESVAERLRKQILEKVSGK